MDEYNEELINTKSVFLNLDKIAVLEEDDDIMLVDLWLLHTGRNRNKMDLKKDNDLKSTLLMLLSKSLLVALVSLGTLAGASTILSKILNLN